MIIFTVPRKTSFFMKPKIEVIKSYVHIDVYFSWVSNFFFMCKFSHELLKIDDIFAKKFYCNLGNDV